jgi:hypothetical protein
VVLVALVLASPLTDVRESYAENDMSEDYRGREIIETVAEKAEPNATILHHRSPLDYMILVENRREDIRLVPYLEDPHPYGVGRGVLAADDGPVYVLFPGRTNTPYYLGVDVSRNLYQSVGYDLAPVDESAILYKVVRERAPRPEEDRDGGRKERVDPARPVET